MFRYRLSNDSMPPSRLLSLVYRNFAQQPEIAEHAAGAEHHRGQRIVGDRNRQAGLFANALVEILEHGAAAGDHDSAVADIGAEFGRSALKGHADGIDDNGHAFRKGFANFRIADGDGARDAFNEVAALDLHGERAIERKRRADFNFDGFGRALPDQHVVLALEILHYGI